MLIYNIMRKRVCEHANGRMRTLCNSPFLVRIILIIYYVFVRI